MKEDILTTKQAAEILGLHPVTLRKWQAKAELTLINKCAVMEDCNGLIFYYEHPRKIMYYASSVNRFKRILNRRKTKQCTKIG